jgi:hypothetical protein
VANTFVAGQTLTAAQLNTLFPTLGAWDPYVPTLTQGVTVTKTSNSAYFRAGRMVIAQFGLSITSAGTTNNPISVGLPVPGKAFGSLDSCGTFVYYDVGATVQNGVASFASATALWFRVGGVSQSPVLGQTGGSLPGPGAIAAAAGDYLGGLVIYEAAS